MTLAFINPEITALDDLSNNVIELVRNVLPRTHYEINSGVVGETKVIPVNKVSEARRAQRRPRPDFVHESDVLNTQFRCFHVRNSNSLKCFSKSKFVGRLIADKAISFPPTGAGVVDIGHIRFTVDAESAGGSFLLVTPDEV